MAGRRVVARGLRGAGIRLERVESRRRARGGEVARVGRARRLVPRRHPGRTLEALDQVGAIAPVAAVTAVTAVAAVAALRALETVAEIDPLDPLGRIDAIRAIARLG